MTDVRAILNPMAEVAWPILREVFIPSCCIPATKVAIYVLDHFGIEAEPVSVAITVGNARFRELAEAHDVLPDDWKERWPDAYTGGVAWAVDTDPDGKEWAGHLMAGFDGFLVDLSFPQFSRPKYGIQIDAGAVFPVPPDFHAPDRGWETYASEEDDAWVALRANPANDHWKETPPFASRRDEKLLRRAAGKIIRAVKLSQGADNLTGTA